MGAASTMQKHTRGRSARARTTQMRETATRRQWIDYYLAQKPPKLLLARRMGWAPPAEHAAVLTLQKYWRCRWTRRAVATITARQLESLNRLAEARARMDLREVVTDADAIDAIEVVKETILYDVLTDAVGSYDVAGGTGAPPQRGGGFAAPAGGGKKPSFGKVANDFSSFLMYDCDQRTSALYTVAELQEAFNRSGLPNPKNTFAEFAEAFNSAGYTLIQSVNGQRGWKVQGSGISMHGSQR